MSESKEIVNWEETMRQEAKAIAAVERPSVTNISTKSGIMSMNDVPIPGNKLPCIVIGSVFENVLYLGQFDAMNIVPPDCFALGEAIDGQTPIMVKHEACADNEFGPECASCPMFAWGSDTKRPNSKGKACKEKRRLALLPATAVQDGQVAKAEMALISVPTTSVRNWGNFVNLTAAEYGRPPWGVLTQISVQPHQKNNMEMKFECMGVVADQYLAEVYKRLPAAREILMQPYDMTPPAPRQAPQTQAGRKY